MCCPYFATYDPQADTVLLLCVHDVSRRLFDWLISFVNGSLQSTGSETTAFIGRQALLSRKFLTDMQGHPNYFIYTGSLIPEVRIWNWTICWFSFEYFVEIALNVHSALVSGLTLAPIWLRNKAVLLAFFFR